MSNDIKAGDKVRLKVVGPAMVVIDVGDYGPLSPNPGAKCEWIGPKGRLEDVFAVTSLEPYTGGASSIKVTRA